MVSCPGRPPSRIRPGPYARFSDPSVAYDARHHTWLISTLGIGQTSNGLRPADVLASRSTDGGTTWYVPTTVHRATGGNLNRFQMSTSADGGTTWAAPRTSPVLRIRLDARHRSDRPVR